MNTPNTQAGEYIKSNREELAKEIFENHLKFQDKKGPELKDKHGSMFLGGLKYQLLYLSESISYSTPELFLSALNWGKSYMPSIGLETEHINMVLNSMKEAFRDKLPSDIKDVTIDFIDEGISKLEKFSGKTSSFINEENKYSKEAKKYLDLLLDSKRSEAGKMILDMAENGTPVKDLYLNIFQVTQYEIGRLWQIGKVTVAQEHYCTAATQLIMSQLYSYIFQSENIDKVFIGTCVSGELHEIGIRMLSDLLEMEGWDTHYLGANMPVESIVQTIKDKKADLVGISATMTFHIHEAEELIKEIRADKDCTDTKIMVGGYVFNVGKELWKTIGADGFGSDLEESLKKAQDLTKKD